FFQPLFVVLVQTGLVVVDKNRSSDVHGVHEAKAFLHAALAHTFLDLRSDVQEVHPRGNVERQVGRVRFHCKWANRSRFAIAGFQGLSYLASAGTRSAGKAVRASQACRPNRTPEKSRSLKKVARKNGRPNSKHEIRPAGVSGYIGEPIQVPKLVSKK